MYIQAYKQGNRVGSQYYSQRQEFPQVVLTKFEERAVDGVAPFVNATATRSHFPPDRLQPPIITWIFRMRRFLIFMLFESHTLGIMRAADDGLIAY